jgi:hypothetical protein
MTEAQARKQAAKASKTQGPQFVVWVFDQGRDIFDSEQARIYAPLIQIEAVYVGGVEVAQEVAA